MLSLDTSWLVALLIGLVTLYVVKFISNVKRLPSGPLPLPIIGSLLVFLKNRNNLCSVFKQLAEKYDGVYTLWVGSVPFVFVANWELCKEALLTKRNDFISRPNFNSMKHSMKNIDAITFHSNTKHWEVSRKVAYSAVRKFSDSETLARIVQRNIENMLSRMLAIKEPFNPKDILQETTFDIVAQTAFGTQKLNEADINIFKTFSKMFHDTMAISPGDFFPLLSPFFRHIDNSIRKIGEDVRACVRRKFQQLKSTYIRGELRHFADSVISAKIEEETKDNANSQYLDDATLEKIVSDLFLAGTDTTTLVLHWMFLALSQFPEIQESVRIEITENIGTRTPTQEDRVNCPYTWAFISEILRIRAPIPMLIPHATTQDTELGGSKIPKGTTVVFDTNSSHFDSTIWEEPDKLKPERFLDTDGEYNTSRLPGFLTFGEGKRSCIGEKMARNFLFLALTNILQKVKIVPYGTKNLSPLSIANNPFFNLTKHYEISLVAII